MRFQIPADFHCEACTLQWRWWTSNSCIPKSGYGCYFQLMRENHWDADSWCDKMCGTCESETEHMQDAEARCNGEEFKNCVDIAVKGSEGTTPAPTPLAPTPAPTTPPTAAPTPAPPVGTCVRNLDCDANAWCNAEGYEEWCKEQEPECPSPMCTRQ